MICLSKQSKPLQIYIIYILLDNVKAELASPLLKKIFNLARFNQYLHTAVTSIIYISLQSHSECQAVNSHKLYVALDY